MHAKTHIAKLKRLRLWPIVHTRAFYRRAARRAPEAFVRALVLIAADRLPPLP